jgi:hypothetical protein
LRWRHSFVGFITPTSELSKLFELIEKAVVDGGRVGSQNLLPTRGDFEMTSLGNFYESSLAEIRLRPVNPVAENRLFT